MKLDHQLYLYIDFFKQGRTSFKSLLSWISPIIIFPDLNKDGKIEWKDFDMAREVNIASQYVRYFF